MTTTGESGSTLRLDVADEVHQAAASSTTAEVAAPEGVRTHVRAFVRGRPHLLVGLGSFVLIIAVVVVRNRWILTTGRYEDGDFAVNSILIDQARHLRLLVGNYSRVGFHHPGPALLYVQAVGEMLLYDVARILPRPFNAQVLAMVIFYAALVGASAAVVARRTGSLVSGAIVPLTALVLGVAQPGALVSTWFPDVYIWPFLFTCIALASVISDEPRDLPLLVIGVGLLVHGHVSFVLFAGGFFVLAAIALRRSARAGRVTVSRRTWILSGSAACVFALPFVLNLILHYPGELSKYWTYSRSGAAGNHTIGQVVDFVLQYWGSGTTAHLVGLGLVVATIALVADTPRCPARTFASALVIVVAAASVLTLIYAYRGVDDLGFDYVAEFYRTAPTIICLALGIALVVRLRGRRVAGWMCAAALVVAMSALATSDSMAARYTGAPWIPAATSALNLADTADETLIFRFDNDAWPYVAGVVEERRRAGEGACVEDGGLTFLFSSEAICHADQLRSGVIVVASTPHSAPLTAPGTPSTVFDYGDLTLTLYR